MKTLTFILKNHILIFCIFSITFFSCKKLKGDFQIVIQNTTPYHLKNLNVECGADPIYFDVEPYSLSQEKTLGIGGREIVAPIMLSISLKQYLNDTLIVNYNKGVEMDRTKIKSGRINYIKTYIDSTKLPEVNFEFVIE
ncbi:MAG: hypothetical protein RLZZ175_1422 [Bacteroidota bacterium]|jgi:hypothetical protein